MRRLLVGTSAAMVTSDGVAAAVMRYAMKLANDRTADVVSIPAIVFGEIVECELLLGSGVGASSIEDDTSGIQLPNVEGAELRILELIRSS